MTEMETIDFKIGQKYKLTISGNVYKIHIVSIINEGLSFCPMVIFRYFGKSKQWWHYEIKSAYSLTGEIEITKKFEGGERQ